MAPDSTNRCFVLEQGGIIKVFENNQTTTSYEIFLNITSQVATGGELGLLGFVFHPNFSLNGYFYVDYTASDPLRTVISRFKVDDSLPNKANASSELIILEVIQPYTNHKGGQLAFGPDDGYLYIAMGDGGSGGDPLGNAQNRSSLLGKILRIDVDAGLPYAIPIDNPFRNNSLGYREEIWAYGLRNPWRFSFDTETGWLWTGDVGQGSWEEIDIIQGGKNYGWNIMEGFECYNSPSCNITGLVLPIFSYGRSSGHSIIGGFIYRGSELGWLNGRYIYGDFVFGTIWALEYDGSQAINSLLIDTDLLITSFGLDQDNELFICAYNGIIYKILPL
ncbi:MAG: PQQ-dependent sugar dehydrogenase [Candidatus Helarchaeota archaeon]|nr:PQQ-dependent sugar dehydrogenase [Candidatus Helarchaeota archaeon]